jgi:hypothetical protein
MDPKPKPNHRQYILALRAMSGEARLQQAFNLTEMVNSLFRQGLRERFPQLSEAELHQLYLKRLEKCHNQNY